MSISIVGTPVQANSSTSLVGSLNVTGIPSTQVGDLLTMHIALALLTGTATVTMPSGWVQGPHVANGTANQAEIWYYPNNPGGITSVTITISGATAVAAATFVEYSGADLTAPLDTSATATSSGTSPTVTTPAIAVLTNDLVTGICAAEATLGQTFTTASGYSKIGTDVTGSAVADSTCQVNSAIPFGLQTFAVTLGTSESYAIAIAAWKTPNKVVFITSGITTTIPSDMSSVNRVDTFGGGGGGGGAATNGAEGGGGGGGGFSQKFNQTLTPGGSVTVAIGAAGNNGNASGSNGTNGGDTCFGASSLGSCTVGAQGGRLGNGGITNGVGGAGGAGGAAASGVGDTKYSGGAGATGGGGLDGGSGGGGAGGQQGNGGAGGGPSTHTGGNGGGGSGDGVTGTVGQAGATSTTTSGAAGGNNAAGAGAGTAGGGAAGGVGTVGGGGGGGGPGNHAGGDGGPGALYTQTSDSSTAGGGGGGGGGGGNSSGTPGAAGVGGLYGGGGAGGVTTNSSSKAGAKGAAGIIILIYASAPATANPHPSRDQRFDNLPSYDESWEKFFTQRLPSTPPVVNPPPTKQADQRFDALPSIDESWEKFFLQTIPSSPPVVSTPPAKRVDQRFDALPDYNGSYWEQFLRSPIIAYQTILYPRLEEGAPPGLVLPSGYLGTVDQSNNANSGANANCLDTTPSLGPQKFVNPTWSSIAAGNTKVLAHAQFCSQPLASNFYPAATWKIGYAGILLNGGSTLTSQGGVGVFLVNGSTGAIRTTLYANIIGLSRTNSTERTIFGTLPLTAFAPVDGDYLVFEMSLIVDNSGASPATPSSGCFTSGTVSVTSDNGVASNAQSAITVPFHLVFLPTNPPTRQPDQRAYVLPDYNEWWEQFRTVPIPLTFLSAPFPPQHDQRVDPLPVLNSWWEQFKQQPIPVSSVIVVAQQPVQLSQRIDPLPIYDWEWEQFKLLMPVEQDAAPSHQPDQRFNPLPIYDWEWEQWKQQPVAVTFLPTPFPPPHDQRFDPLFIFNWEWEQFRIQPNPVTYTGMPPALGQHDQRFDSLPVFDTWSEQFRTVPVPLTFLPTPFPPQHDQRFDPLFIYNWEWEQFRLQPNPVTYTGQPPALGQHDQRAYVLPIYDWEWEQYKQQPVPLTFLITPFPPQHDQRFNPLPIYDWEWEQFRAQPVPITFTFVQPPLPPSQRIDPLPVIDSWSEQFRVQPIPVTFLPTPFPPQHDQRVDPLVDFSTWAEQFKTQPTPVTFLPTPFPPQHDQRFNPLITWDTWAEQFRIQPVPFTFVPYFPPNPSQRVDPLFVFDSWWEQFKTQPVPVTYLSMPPTMPAHDQRHDPLPVVTSWWEQFKSVPVPLTFLITPFPPQHDQRFDPLPIYDWEWEQFRIQPNPVSFVPYFGPNPSQRIDPLPVFDSWWEQFKIPIPIQQDRPPSHQLDQRVDPLPVLNSWWEQFKVQPSPVTFLVTPFPPQHSQRFDPLPVFDTWAEQFKLQPIPFTFVPYFGPNPSQRIDPLFVFDTWWEKYPIQPIPVSYIPTPPPPHQLSQDSVINNPAPINTSWWEQFRLQPIPVSYFSTAPPTYQPSQRFDSLTVYDEIWWNHSYPRMFLPSNYFDYKEGTCRIYTSFSQAAQQGSDRIANFIEGYVVWAGTSPPDLTQPPTSYSPSLPINIPVVVPGSGTSTYYVVVRYRDMFGLFSQNQRETTITIDDTGHLILPALLAPANVSAIPSVGNQIKVLSSYPNYQADEFPADTWKVWINTVPPVPSVDPPTWTGPVQASTNAILISSYTAGSYYVTVGLYRTLDGVLSPTTQITIVYPAPPSQPHGVHGRYEEN